MNNSYNSYFNLTLAIVIYLIGLFWVLYRRDQFTNAHWRLQKTPWFFLCHACYLLAFAFALASFWGPWQAQRGEQSFNPGDALTGLLKADDQSARALRLDIYLDVSRSMYAKERLQKGIDIIQDILEATDRPSDEHLEVLKRASQSASQELTLVSLSIFSDRVERLVPYIGDRGHLSDVLSAIVNAQIAGGGTNGNQLVLTMAQEAEKNRYRNYRAVVITDGDIDEFPMKVLNSSKKGAPRPPLFIFVGANTTEKIEIEVDGRRQVSGVNAELMEKLEEHRPLIQYWDASNFSVDKLKKYLQVEGVRGHSPSFNQRHYTTLARSAFWYFLGAMVCLGLSFFFRRMPQYRHLPFRISHLGCLVVVGQMLLGLSSFTSFTSSLGQAWAIAPSEREEELTVKYRRGKILQEEGEYLVDLRRQRESSKTVLDPWLQKFLAASPLMVPIPLKISRETWSLYREFTETERNPSPRSLFNYFALSLESDQWEQALALYRRSLEGSKKGSNYYRYWVGQNLLIAIARQEIQKSQQQSGGKGQGKTKGEKSDGKSDLNEMPYDVQDLAQELTIGREQHLQNMIYKKIRSTEKNDSSDFQNPQKRVRKNW